MRVSLPHFFAYISFCLAVVLLLPIYVYALGMSPSQLRYKFIENEQSADGFFWLSRSGLEEDASVCIFLMGPGREYVQFEQDCMIIPAGQQAIKAPFEIYPQGDARGSYEIDVIVKEDVDRAIESIQTEFANAISGTISFEVVDDHVVLMHVNEPKVVVKEDGRVHASVWLRNEGTRVEDLDPKITLNFHESGSQIPKKTLSMSREIQIDRHSGKSLTTRSRPKAPVGKYTVTMVVEIDDDRIYSFEDILYEYDGKYSQNIFEIVSDNLSALYAFLILSIVAVLFLLMKVRS